ncbi:putative serine/threonine-protein kinase pats1 OS=Dictyostelium discoideum GN=pats1 PE=3 SV=1 [Rhizoctonia solani AG-1 IB]|uniref:Putative serine/threonine-protein kinase pats1 n=1 Tax=Thanatephorus cucumeris (strain AG1-IB / isolate 7/3/14) TaxID=1108050 RepID=A0A0B7FA55_THACB|nr:putative serine/threonine-protein kinase pats1 OS=Dictyostelium discoideum GN=pats1 PE=3 SV=1 [Rhizoctonia solani AG-1 IB]
MARITHRDLGNLSMGDTISRKTPTHEVFTQLLSHGNTDVTTQLNLNSLSQYPVANGGAGDVYRGLLLDGLPVAMKRLRIISSNDDEVVGQDIKYAAHETYVWSKCKHPNVLELIGIAQCQDRIMMVSPWMNNGNLSQLPKDSGADLFNMFAQIADGVAYLHDQGIVHGDIKGANILISDDHIPKLTDFGTSSLNKYTLQFTSGSELGNGFTIRFTAPEILSGGTKNTIEGDVYSLGMTMLAEITRTLPYREIINEVVVATKILTGKHPERPEDYMPTNQKRSDAVWDLLTQCWRTVPQDRPRASKLADRLKGFQSTIDKNMSINQILACLDYHGCQCHYMDEKLPKPGSRLVGGASNNSTAYNVLRHGKLAFRYLVDDQTGHEVCGQDLVIQAHELYVWSQCKHRYILKFLGATNLGGKLATISPWMKRGTLGSFMTQTILNRSELCRQVADAVVYLHSKGIAHGNISIANILVSDNRHAPENKCDGRLYEVTFESDVYALGHTILDIMLCNRTRYKPTSLYGNAATIPKRPKRYLSPGNEQADFLWSLLKRCWSASPENRPKASHVRNALRKITDEGLWESESEGEGEEDPDETIVESEIIVEAETTVYEETDDQMS